MDTETRVVALSTGERLPYDRLLLATGAFTLPGSELEGVHYLRGLSDAHRREADAVPPEGSPLRGRVAIANAQLAYARHLERFAGRRWAALREAGAKPQGRIRSSGATQPESSVAWTGG